MNHMIPVTLSLMASLTAAVAGEWIEQGLLLDLDADHGIALQADQRIHAWTNRASTTTAAIFRQQDEGRQEPGSGRPALRTDVPEIPGQRSVVFLRQELINFEEDAFDHLTTGSGYTWFSVMKVYDQVPVLKDVNCFFGNLRNGGNYEGFWAGLTDDNRIWAGTRNGITFGRWDENNPQVLGPRLETGQYYVVAGRMSSGMSQATIELFVNSTQPVASSPIQINPDGDPSKMAVGQERDATNHPGAESFDGEIARFLIYERDLANDELRSMMTWLKTEYHIKE